MIQFTKEIKEKWLEALKSRNYIQAFDCFQGGTIDRKTTYCCIAVLDSLIEEESSPYRLLETIDKDTVRTLIKANDNPSTRPKNRDYSNVIPIIESLPTVD